MHTVNGCVFDISYDIPWASAEAFVPPPLGSQGGLPENSAKRPLGFQNPRTQALNCRFLELANSVSVVLVVPVVAVVVAIAVAVVIIDLHVCTHICTRTHVLIHTLMASFMYFPTCLSQFACRYRQNAALRVNCSRLSCNAAYSTGRRGGRERETNRQTGRQRDKDTCLCLHRNMKCTRHGGKLKVMLLRLQMPSGCNASWHLRCIWGLLLNWNPP